MRVLVPYVRLSEYTRTSLEADGHRPIYAHTPGPFGYIEALETLWSTGKGFVLVEQDKVPWPGALKAIWECPEDWCVFPAKTAQGNFVDFPTLATVKFSDAMVKANPDFMAQVRTISVGDKPAGYWGRLDMAIYDMATRCRIAPHWHEPEVLHYHEEGD